MTSQHCIGDYLYLIHVGSITPNPVTCKYLSYVIETCYKDSSCLGIMISGGCGFCYRELLRAKSFNLRVLAITNWLDDVFSIRLLKNLDFFIGGTWKSLNSVLIGGVDGKEPYQSINRLIKEYNNIKSSVPIIILSYHPMKGVCDKVISMNLHIGLDILSEIISRLNVSALLSSHISINNPCIMCKNSTIIINTPPLERGIYSCVYLDTWDVRFEFTDPSKESC